MAFSRIPRSIVTVALVLAATTAAGLPPARDEATAKLEGGGAAILHVDPINGLARFIRMERGSPIAAGLQKESAPSQAAAFIARYGEIVGVTDFDRDLRLTSNRVDSIGNRHLVYQRRFRGLPIFGAELRFHFDADGVLSSINGRPVPEPELDPVPHLTSREAAAIATSFVSLGGSRWRPVTTSFGPVRPVASRLGIYKTGFVRGVPGSDYLVWIVTVRDGLGTHTVFVDASRGAIVESIDNTPTDLYRRVFIGEASYPSSVFWEEGMPRPTSIPEADRALDGAKLVYDFFLNAFGLDSWDGEGGTFDDVIDGNLLCPASYWNGDFVGYCTGSVHQDVVGHEWGHGYTSTFIDPVYMWQTGALTEAYSSIWGETIDLLHDDPDELPIGRRSPTGCSLFTPDTGQFVKLVSPYEVAGIYLAYPLTRLLDPAPAMTGEVVRVGDGCQSPFANGAEIVGHVAFVIRGGCSLATKLENMEAAGATGMIVANDAAGGERFDWVTAARSPLPAYVVGYHVGQLISDHVAEGVNVVAGVGDTLEASARWLYSEDSPGRGAGYGDFWNPRCDRCPGRMSEYSCSSDDRGSTHSNAFILVHAYALLADGGSFNGFVIDGIGLTKAAHIYTRAARFHQTSVTDFADHADALEQSCADLIGQDLADPLTGNASGEVVEPADCQQVASAIRAVELRSPPAHCDFEPLLGQSPPSLCEGVAVNVLHEDFESDPIGWTFDSTHPARFDKNWTVVDVLPGSRVGRALFAPDDLRYCFWSGGRSTASSPVARVPDDATGLHLSFDHYVASRFEQDGGNVSVRVNSGPWQTIQAEDFVYNPYSSTVSENLPGRVAFTGTDEGEVSGSWGRSIVDLSGYADPGDEIEIRFTFATDGCNGIDGWYVDDVRLFYCSSSGESSPRKHPVRRPD